MINKKLLKILISIILIICILSFFTIQYSKKGFDDLIKTNEANITKVFMRSGSNGSYVQTTDKKKIKEIINLVNNRYYTKAFNQSPRSGYCYYYDFYSNKKLLIRLTGAGNNVAINDTYYNVSKSISLDGLGKWFKSLSIKPFK